MLEQAPPFVYMDTFFKENLGGFKHQLVTRPRQHCHAQSGEGGIADLRRRGTAVLIGIGVYRFGGTETLDPATFLGDEA